MRTYFFALGGFLLSFAPLFAHGEVVINEVAWMGTGVSATDEWIELYNGGTEDVSLSGWKVSADDGAPTIELTGTVVADGYYLLERIDDTTVPDIPADKIYSGDLGNGGETLTLFDATGIAVDTVLGGSEWKTIGGNNTSKDTPQRQQDGTWITGVPTPRVLNTTIATPQSSGSGSSGGSTTSTKKTITGGYKQVVFAYAGEDVTGVVGADILFEGYAVSDTNKRLSVANYSWAFGDGSRGKSKEVTHAYREEGTYVVTLKVSSNNQKWQDKLLVTILPAQIYLQSTKSGSDGYIEVRNDADTELDLSEWKLTVLYTRKSLRDKSFMIPEGTLIAPRSAVRFPFVVTELIFADHDTVVLQYPSGKRVTELNLSSTNGVEAGKEQKEVSNSLIVPSSVEATPPIVNPPTTETLSVEKIYDESDEMDSLEAATSSAATSSISLNPPTVQPQQLFASVAEASDGGVGERAEPLYRYLLFASVLIAAAIGTVFLRHQGYSNGREDPLTSEAAMYTLIDVTPPKT